VFVMRPSKLRKQITIVTLASVSRGLTVIMCTVSDTKLSASSDADLLMLTDVTIYKTAK
jgi:hypothetical protein